MAIGNAIGIGFGNLIVTIATIIQTFKARVLLDSGTFEAESYLLTQNANNIQSASFVYIPAAFKAGVDYSIKGDDLTHARNSVAYRNNASNVLEQMAANVGRVSYVGGVPTLLNEPLRTNLITFSENYTDASWTKGNCTITANAGTAPTGLNTAQLFNEGNASANHTLSKGGIVFVAGNYIIYQVIKAVNRNFVGLASVNANIGNIFNLTTNTVTSNLLGGSLTNPFCIDHPSGNGWKIIGGQTNNPNNISFFVFAAINGTTVNYQGTNQNCYLLAGSQVELGTTLSSYILTTTAAVTRVADVATVTRSFTANSTIFQNVYLNAGSLSDGVQYTLLDARVSSTVRITLYRLNNNLVIDVINSTTQYSGTVWTLPTLVQNTVYKIAIVTTATGFKVFVNGALRYTSGTLSMPTLTSATYAIGCDATGANQYNGSIINNFVENTNLDDATCITRTT